MNFLSQFLREYTDMFEHANFFEHVLLVLWFSFFTAGVMVVLATAVIWSIWCLHEWWYGPGDAELIFVQAADVVTARAGDTGADQADHLRCRQAAHSSAQGESSSSSSNATGSKEE